MAPFTNVQNLRHGRHRRQSAKVRRVVARPRGHSGRVRRAGRPGETWLRRRAVGFSPKPPRYRNMTTMARATKVWREAEASGNHQDASWVVWQVHGDGPGVVYQWDDCLMHCSTSFYHTGALHHTGCTALKITGSLSRVCAHSRVGVSSSLSSLFLLIKTRYSLLAPCCK